MNIDPRKRYRIEFRSFNIGDGVVPDWAPRSGLAHNFIAVIEVQPDGQHQVIGEIHGMSQDRGSGSIKAFDIVGAGRLVTITSSSQDTNAVYYGRSQSNPSFVLFEGGGAAVKTRLDRAAATAAWINRQDFGYELVGNNSNAVAYTLARAMGFDVTGQPIDRATGRHLPAPGGTIDLTRLKPGAPPPIADPVRVNGYGAENRPASPARDASRASGLDPAGLIFGRDAAERVRARHGFDPRAGVTTSEQKESIRAWLADAVAPKLAVPALPAALGGDLLVRAARTSPTAAARVLQEGLNRFGAPSVSVDGWVGPETLGALERRLDAHGADVVRGAVALGGLNRDLDAMAKGELRAETAPSVFRDGIGRLFGAGARVERAPGSAKAGGRGRMSGSMWDDGQARLEPRGPSRAGTASLRLASPRAKCATARRPARGFEPALAAPDREDRERWGGLV